MGLFSKLKIVKKKNISCRGTKVAGSPGCDAASWAKLVKSAFDVADKLWYRLASRCKNIGNRGIREPWVDHTKLIGRFVPIKS